MSTQSIGWLSPLPPARTGIASYSRMILDSLATRAEVVAYTDQPEVDPLTIPVRSPRDIDPDHDAIVYQLGNNLHHEFVYRAALQRPGILVLHDIVLNHLITEMTLARGKADEYLDEMRANHGEAGAAFARARAHGMHYEMGNFLFPCSTRICNRSRLVVVHNRWAADRLKLLGVTTPIRVIEHPIEEEPTVAPRMPESSFESEARVIGVFGFVTAAKRAGSIMRAFAKALALNPRLRLVFVGQPAPDVDLPAIARRAGLPQDVWTTTGYVTDAEFAGWLERVDRVIALRYPTAGESSGPLTRVFAVGKPVAVSDYAQFHELDPDLVVRIPLGKGETEALSTFMTTELDTDGLAARQQRAVRRQATASMVADAYLDLLGERESMLETAPIGSSSTLALLPRLEVSDTGFERGRGRVTIRNDGDSTLPAYRYGAPAYKIDIVIRDDRGVQRGAPLLLHGDLRPGENQTLEIDVQPGETVELYHAHHDLPRYPLAPFWTGVIG